jgi:ParB family chromosome partitioning protein
MPRNLLKPGGLSGLGVGKLGSQVANGALTGPRADDFVATVMLPVASIRPDPGQPRRRFDEAAIEALASSIEEKGLLNPVIVRPDPKGKDSYILVAGERRWRALGRLGRETVSAVVRHVDELEARRLALVDNVQREDLGTLEVARALHSLASDHGMDIGALAKLVGRGRNDVSVLVRAVDTLPRELFERLESVDRVSVRALTEIVRAEPAEQLRLVGLVESGAASDTVRDARAAPDVLDESGDGKPIRAPVRDLRVRFPEMAARFRKAAEKVREQAGGRSLSAEERAALTGARNAIDALLQDR